MEATKKPEKDHHQFHAAIWKIIRPITCALAWLKFNFTAKPVELPGPSLIISNHNTDWDPMLLPFSFKQMIYYVASEHLLRSGLGGKIVKLLVDPIPRQKGGNATPTVMAILRRLKKGYNVGIFAEGNRSWDGVTGYILPTIGKVARTSGAYLVTYKISGGYFGSPRWSGKSSRRGKMTGEVVNIYSPEQLKAMKPEEIYEHIRQDLQEDAYERQRKNPIAFHGKHLAEHLERLLCICPDCMQQGTLQSSDNKVKCWKCGLSFEYLPSGFLDGKNLPADNIRDWNKWQTQQIYRICDEASGALPIFSDGDIRCDLIETASGTKRLGKGDLKLFKDHLELPGKVSIPLEELSGVSLVGAQDLYIGTKEDKNYLLRSDLIKCLVKYQTACSYLTGETFSV